MNKQQKPKIYCKDGLTLYNVSDNKNILKMTQASFPYIMQLAKEQMLPYTLYVEGDDLKELNSQIFSRPHPHPVYVYIFGVNKEKPDLIIRDVKHAPKELLEEIKESDAPSVSGKTDLPTKTI